jgi:protein-L-isoaspartate(D-aspartate) O-methyltransferase
MVAIMTELLDPKPKDRVLEIGAGSGYQATVLSKLVKEIWTMELDPRLAKTAEDNLRKAKIKNVHVLTGDGWLGHKTGGRYDKIIITCAVPSLPPGLKRQLKDGGIMLAPVGGYFHQRLIKAVKERGRLKETSYGMCVFVPLRRKG